VPGVNAAASVRQAMRLLPCVKQPPSAGVARPGTHPVTAEPAALHEPPAAGPERRQAAGRRAQHGQQMNVRIRACQSRCRATATAGSGRKDNTGRGRLTSRSARWRARQAGVAAQHWPAAEQGSTARTLDRLPQHWHKPKVHSPCCGWRPYHVSAAPRQAVSKQQCGYLHYIFVLADDVVQGRWQPVPVVVMACRTAPDAQLRCI